MEMTVRDSIENYISYMMEGRVSFSIERLITMRRYTAMSRGRIPAHSTQRSLMDA